MDSLLWEGKRPKEQWMSRPRSMRRLRRLCHLLNLIHQCHRANDLTNFTCSIRNLPMKGSIVTYPETDSGFLERISAIGSKPALSKQWHHLRHRQSWLLQDKLTRTGYDPIHSHPFGLRIQTFAPNPNLWKLRTCLSDGWQGKDDIPSRHSILNGTNPRGQPSAESEAICD